MTQEARLTWQWLCDGGFVVLIVLPIGVSNALLRSIADDLLLPDECEGDLTPVITDQPASLTVCQGETATFTVGAFGTEPLNYQWRLDGNSIAGATASAYTIEPASPPDAGDYDVVVESSCGTTTSYAATLTVVTTEDCDDDNVCTDDIC